MSNQESGFIEVGKWEYPTKKYLEMKIQIYIANQLKQKGLKENIGNSC